MESNMKMRKSGDAAIKRVLMQAVAYLWNYMTRNGIIYGKREDESATFFLIELFFFGFHLRMDICFIFLTILRAS
jgi:hypothetical protein